MITSAARFRPVLAAVLATSAITAAACGTAPADTAGPPPVTLEFLVDDSDQVLGPARELVAAFTAAHPDVTVDVQTRPEGQEGDLLVRNRLTTYRMADVFQYNSGSLLQGLNPLRWLQPLSDEPWVADLDENFRTAVSASRQVFGAPFSSAAGGGVLYNKRIYRELGLQVPRTWAEFTANNARIAATDIDPVIQTYRDPWTSQLFVLADFHNVAAAEPAFAQDFTANRARFATTPAALLGFQRLAQVHDAGHLNRDFARTGFDDGLRVLASGEGAHYPMLTYAVGPLVAQDPAAAEDIGFFALPGDDAATNGATLWLSSGVYIPSTTRGPQLDAARRFLAFVASPAGCDAMTRGTAPAGPYLVRGCTLPADAPAAIRDLQSYVDRGAASPALEFLSPLKGSSLEQITVDVGSGRRTPEDGAAFYDQDVQNRALELGLPDW
jgi:raffinose/stachyose/melibiose transport system substrate-binding protein